MAPAVHALRRIRARPLPTLVLIAAVAGATGLIGWSSVAAALSHEDNVRVSLREVARDERSLQVTYRLQARERASARFFETMADVTAAPRRVEVWQSVGQGIRLVVPADVAADTTLTAGRRPRGCSANVCEALALVGGFRVGQRVPLERGISVRIVGQGSLRPEVLPTGSEALPRTPELGDSAIAVSALHSDLIPLILTTTSVVAVTASLEPDKVHGSELRALIERLRTESVRLGRDGPGVEVTAPRAMLERLADRGDVARERLFMVAGQAAALVIAFAAFAASTRRADSRLRDEQLGTLSASRLQTLLTRLVEGALPSLVGGLIGLVGVRVGVEVLAVRNELPPGFASAALPFDTVLAIAAVVTGATTLLVASLAPRRRARFGIGALEVAAVTAFAFVVWQTATTGGLDPERFQAGESPGPILLLLPALAFFVSGTVLLRALPPILRLLERASRTTPFGVRLAFVAAARNPAQAAAATTFLAVALGSALFALNYRASLERQANDQAEFTAGASWRVSERASAADRARGGSAPRGADTSTFTGADVRPVGGAADVTPLTRWTRVGSEPAVPVLRLRGRIGELAAAGADEAVEVLAVPAARLVDVRGWRSGFSPLAPSAIAARLRSRVELAGIRLARDARVLRAWMRAETTLPRFVLLHFLHPADRRFVHVRVGELSPSWRRLSLRIPPVLRGADLVGIEFPPVFVPFSSPPDRGFVELGRLEQRRPRGWAPLPRLDEWKASPAGGSVEPAVASGPVRRPIQFSIEDTPLALMRPQLPLPASVPALVSAPVADAAVDGAVTLDLQGKTLPIRVAASADLFPTVVEEPSRFVVVDYETLFAALNIDQPGLAVPTEAWFFETQRPGFLEEIGEPPFRVETAVGVDPLRARLLSDPLASGAREVLGIAAIAAAALALFGLVLAARSALAAERLLLAEYEALGIPRATLARSTQLRLVVLAALGVAAGALGGVLAVRLIGAFVAVAGTGERPLPPIEPVVDWRADVLVVSAVGLGALVTAAVLAGRALGETAARRLRA